jgi:hypothetical protein
MLSPHEISTLLLVEQSYDSSNLNACSLAVLINRNLIYIDDVDSGRSHLKLTGKGESLLRTITQSHGAGRR